MLSFQNGGVVTSFYQRSANRVSFYPFLNLRILFYLIGMVNDCGDEIKFEYPNIFSISKEKYYNNIGTSKQFCTALEWNYSDDSVDVTLKYIQNQIKKTSELELWSVWLGNGEIPVNINKSLCKIDNLTANRLKDFCVSELDFQCLTIVM